MTQLRLADFKLTAKQARFVAEFAKDLNTTQAAIRAGYAPDSAHANAYRLMALDGVREAIEAARQAFYAALDMSVAEAAAIEAAIARADTREFFDDNGNVKPLSDWSWSMGQQVVGAEVIIKNAQAGDGEVDRVLKLRFADKIRALDMVHRRQGAYAAEKVDVDVNVSVVHERLKAARARLAAARALPDVPAKAEDRADGFA